MCDANCIGYLCSSSSSSSSSSQILANYYLFVCLFLLLNIYNNGSFFSLQIRLSVFDFDFEEEIKNKQAKSEREIESLSKCIYALHCLYSFSFLFYECLTFF